VVVAWKDTREARRAVEDALPLLMLADRVAVVEVAADEELAQARARTEDVADWLARHGVAASARAVVAAKEEATQLWNVVKELDAGLIVGGATAPLLPPSAWEGTTAKAQSDQERALTALTGRELWCAWRWLPRMDRGPWAV
jgi:hypothetical protein